MSTDRAFSDEDLTAFLDGQLDATTAQALGEQLETDADLAARLAALEFPVDMLRAAFDHQLESAPEMPELPAYAARPVPAPANTDAPSANRGWVGFSFGSMTGLAAGLAVAVFTGLGQKAPEPAQRGWLDVVANYQMLYVPQTVIPAGGSTSPYGSASAQPAVLQDLGKVIDLDLTGFANIEGLQFRRAQQLGFNGKPLIQIAYTLPDGTPVAICILVSGKEARGARSQTLEGMAASDWTTGTHGVVIIGGQNQDAIDRLAPAVQSLI